MPDSLNRANRNTLWASIFVEELCRGGVQTACISPGSRSTPLVMALAAHSGIKTYPIIDERSAGFFALGHAKVTGRPVALVCTSGSAAANFHPAVIEAAYGQVPLLVLTADRPPHLRETGAGQTIDQLKLYGNAVRWFFEVGAPRMHRENLRHLRALAARALFEACKHPPGPVHLNFPFSKPLEPSPVPDDVPGDLMADQAPVPRGEGGGAYSLGTVSATAAAPHTLRRIADQLRGAPAGLIVCGPMPAHHNGAGEAEWPHALASLARLAGYPILAEPPSQVRCGPHETSQVIAHGEAILRAPAFRARLKPQLMLRFGSMPTSRQVEVLLEEHPDCPVLLVNEAGTWLEPTHNPTEVISAEPAAFCLSLAEALAGHKQPLAGHKQPLAVQWLDAFREADRIAAAAIREEFAQMESGGNGWFEGRVFTELAELLPGHTLLYTANSMPVRDLEAFTPVTPTAVRYLVNRGANGIDGTLSSALGAAAALREAGGGPAVLVTGDLAFYHDANGLLAAGRNDLNLTVILINNNGGGIFAMLPISQFGETYETLFGTPHGIDFEKLAAAYGVSVLRPGGWAEFRDMVRESLSAEGTQVIEIFTDRTDNRLHHQRVWEAVAARIGEAFPASRELL
ncbi:MAG: 2-succinyl-5-enolpyruvyl-6-hydroxy-3-cyclohexene-1-carboxylic-acid synthase [SAR324 cluster bacterium]|nr:2-succinyl-5-enolpyruvyl-6-hydroxy-3-cyclohexene-1-carboxylic-acid synthase [SAR324 cluster bacterium]